MHITAVRNTNITSNKQKNVAFGMDVATLSTGTAKLSNQALLHLLGARKPLSITYYNNSNDSIVKKYISTIIKDANNKHIGFSVEILKYIVNKNQFKTAKIITVDLINKLVKIQKNPQDTKVVEITGKKVKGTNEKLQEILNHGVFGVEPKYH